MPLPTSKSELLNNINQAYEKLDGELKTITENEARLKQIEGNISCCDVIAYQIGWAKLLLEWEKQELNGEMPEMPALGYKWKQLGALAQAFYKRESGKSLTSLREEFNVIVEEINGWIGSLNEQELLLPHHRKWTGGKWVMVKWIQVNTVAPYRSARTKIRRWKKESEK